MQKCACKLLFLLAIMAFVCVRNVKAELVVEYFFEEGIGVGAGDTSGKGNNATFIGLPTWVTGHTAAIGDANGSKHGLYFDGSSYLSANNSSSLSSLTNKFSLTAWIKADVNSTHDTIVWKSGSFRVWKQNSNLMINLTGVNGSADIQVVSGLISNNTWIHIAVTYDGSRVRGYVSGAYIGSKPASGNISNSGQPLYIGWYSNLPYYRGGLDNIRIYNHTLSSNEILMDMNANILNDYGPFTIVQNGQVNSAIIIPATGYPEVVQYAAQELQYHINKAADANLPIFNENNKPAGYAGLIYIGACNAAVLAGVNGDNLPVNGFILRKFGSDFILSGNDSYGPVLGQLHGNTTRVGTLNAVYDFLEKEMGIKWIWPGAIGEVVPRYSSVVINRVNRAWQPALSHTRFRDYAYRDSAGWSSQAVADAYLNAQSVWLRRQRFVRSVSLEYGHGFTNYWQNYGSGSADPHLDYFNLLPDGTRRSDPFYSNGDNTVISMNVSDPNLWKRVVDTWEAAGDATRFINGIENDTAGKCTCNSCMAWDAEEPNFIIPWIQRLSYSATAFAASDPDWSRYLGSLSDRYAKFWLAIQNEAQSRGYFNASVIGYAYANYCDPPLQTILNDHIIIGIVPPMMFPWAEQTRQAFRDQWSGWTSIAGARAYLRPNYTLEGHNMPVFYADKFGEDFLFAYQRGMFGTDFDSLTGQWATQGPNLYMIARVNATADSLCGRLDADLDADTTVSMQDLEIFANNWLANPCSSLGLCNGSDIDKNGQVDLYDFSKFAAEWLEVDQRNSVSTILNEFYQAFGPAASAVRAYFEYWRTITENTTISPSWVTFYTQAPQIFTPSVMSTGRALLTIAQQAATGDSIAEQRVAYLDQGLRNVELTLAAQAAWDQYQSSSDATAWYDAIVQLDSYRASVDANNVCNMDFLYSLESYGWQRPLLATVSAGKIFAMDTDGVIKINVGGYDLFLFDDLNNDGYASVVVDIGASKVVDAFKLVNRKDVATDYNAKSAEIYIAPDESASNFKPFASSSYTTQVFSGDFQPASNSAGAVRVADVNNSQRRYFLIKFSSNFLGPVVPSNNRVYGADIDITVQ